MLFRSFCTFNVSAISLFITFMLINLGGLRLIAGRILRCVRLVHPGSCCSGLCCVGVGCVRRPIGTGLSCMGPVVRLRSCGWGALKSFARFGCSSMMCRAHHWFRLVAFWLGMNCNCAESFLFCPFFMINFYNLNSNTLELILDIKKWWLMQLKLITRVNCSYMKTGWKVGSKERKRGQKISTKTLK
jgi:hypothetical protein